MEDHRKQKGARVVCGGCKDVGFTARSWQAYQCSGPCKKKLPKSAFSASGANVARAEKNRSLKCKSCK